MDLIDKKIIVTGCASGMGAATVRAYVAAGASVVGMDIADHAGRAVCAEATASGPGDATYVSVDVADQLSVDVAFEEANTHLGSLDAMAHPAAIAASSNAGDVSVADWDQMFAVNVRGTMLTNQAAYQRLKVSGGGAIINFGPISGRRPEPGAAAYSAGRARCTHGPGPRPAPGAQTTCGSMLCFSPSARLWPRRHRRWRPKRSWSKCTGETCTPSRSGKSTATRTAISARSWCSWHQMHPG